MLEDDTAREGKLLQQLEATERRLARRLQLLDELKARDLHECSWTGDARLVAAHLDDAARKGGLKKVAAADQRDADEADGEAEGDVSVEAGVESRAGHSRHTKAA